MDLLLATIDNHQGLASRRELLVNGIRPGWIDVAAWYGWQVIRVRKGWYARPTERRDVLRAWRLGGRLTCVSATAFHAGAVSREHAEAVVLRCGIHGAGVPRRA